MICKICGGKKDTIPLFSIHICKNCLGQLNTIDVFDENYDFYKNMMRIYLSYYMGRNLIQI